MLERISSLRKLTRRGTATTLLSLLASGPICVNANNWVGQFPENSIPPLQEILNAAMTEADSIQLRNLAETEYEGRRQIASAPKNLSIGSSVTLRKEQDFAQENSPTADRLLYSILLSKSLYHWGALKAGKEKGEISLELEELRTFEQYRTLALEIRRRYLAILVAKKDSEISRRNLARSQNLLERERVRLDAGNASVIQVYNMEVSVNAADLDRLRKENAFEDQIQVLARIVGIEPEAISRDLPDEIPTFTPLEAETIAGMEQYFADGIASSSRIQSSSKTVEYYQNDLKITNQRQKPKINLSVGLTQYELDQLGTRRDQEIVYGGVTINWNIFDGGATKGNKTYAMARVESVRRQYESAKSEYRFNLERAQNLLDLNARLLAREEAALSQAQNYARDIVVEVERGQASVDDQDKVETALATQEARTYRARAEYLNALASISSLLGFDPYTQKFIDSRAR